MEIKLYAPVDCLAKDITKCSDSAFAEKMLGDGILIIPLQNEFQSPFENAIVSMIFETKHAYGLKVNDFDVLIHCGLDSVSLKGKPFITSLKINQKIKKSDSLFSVDLEQLKKENISNETPILFDLSNVEKIKIQKFEEREYKKGELITSIKIDLKVKKKDESTELKAFKSKYRLAGEEFLKAVGGKVNYTDVYNCMTRLRFAIVDKKVVDEAAIKKNQLVKGVVWNGLELQIIIGGENYKVKDEILKIEKNADVKSLQNTTIKPSFVSRMLGAIAGIMAPNVPILMTGGILGALYAIFNQIGITDDLGQGTAMGDADLFSAIMYIASKTSLLFVGVFFCVNTVKYFGGNYLMGLLIGLALVSRFFNASGETDSSLWEFGSYVASQKYAVSGWFLFKISDYPIVIRSYEGSVLPFIVAGLIAAYADKWVKTWMPSSVDVIFRSAIVFSIAFFPTLFLLGPLLSLVEFGMSQAISSFESIPLGLGVGLFGLIWQPLVLTGVHVAVIMTLMIPFIAGTPSMMLTAATIAVFAQVGAVIGVSIVTKNRNLRKIALASIPGGIFGVTEPIIYGVNLPKGKPFLIGCAAAFFGSTLSGILGVATQVPSGQGIFTILGYTTIKMQLLYIMVLCITIGIAIGLTFLFYTERNNEFKYYKAINKKSNNLLKKVNYKNLLNYSKKIDAIQQEIFDNKKIFKDYEKYLIESSKIESKLISIENKEELTRAKLFKIADKLNNNPKADSIKRQQAILHYNNYDLENLKSQFTTMRNALEQNFKQIKKDYHKLIENLEKRTDEIVKETSKELDIVDFNNYYNAFWNGINAVDIGYGYLDKKEYAFTKEGKLKFKKLIKPME